MLSNFFSLLQVRHICPNQTLNEGKSVLLVLDQKYWAASKHLYIWNAKFTTKSFEM